LENIELSGALLGLFASNVSFDLSLGHALKSIELHEKGPRWDMHDGGVNRGDFERGADAIHSGGRQHLSNRKRPGRRPDPQLRCRIIKSASELFGMREFHRVRAQELAARAGVGKGTLYRCFGSKRELYLTAIIEGFVELQRRLEKALTNARSPKDKVALIARHTADYFWDRRLFFVLLQTTEPPSGPLLRGFYAQRARLSDMIRSALAEGIAAGELRDDLDPRLCAEALLGMVRGLIRFRKSTDTPATAAHTVVALFFGGMDGCAREAKGSRSHRRRPMQIRRVTQDEDEQPEASGTGGGAHRPSLVSK
jgi:AcrR family transcriptional regulator